jgi:Fe-S-cluster containining protein
MRAAAHVVSGAVSRLPELQAKVDAFFGRVLARHGGDMECLSGCSDCCRVRLTVTGVEASAIRAHVASWPDEQRRELARTGGADRCAALDAAGRCRIYEARPLVCRSHGVPVRLSRGGLPVVESCPRNFRTTEADADCVLDQATLSAMLLAVDAEAASATGGAQPTRVDLASLLAELAAI